MKNYDLEIEFRSHPENFEMQTFEEYCMNCGMALEYNEVDVCDECAKSLAEYKVIR